MNPSNCSSVTVRELFQSLLTNTAPPPRLSSSTTPSAPLTSPPPRQSIRFIENDPNNRREKYDGRRWRLVCTWDGRCTNVAAYCQLCQKHNLLRKNKQLPAPKRKALSARSSLPITNQYNHHQTAHNKNNNNNDDEDDIQILEDYCTGPSHRHSMNNHVKTETPDFHVFSVEHVDETNLFDNIKSEPRASSSYRPSTAATNDVEYLSSKTRPNGLNITELVSKNIPPLTDFEEEYLATRMMQRFPHTCSMLDAQLFLHNEAISVVKQNYRVKMDNIAPEYFYDFLLRHPRVALHYGNWFSRCKPIPPNTGCPIDTKVWTLSMIVRGATPTDNLDD